ncbi:hypothetical protein D3C80_1911480 [compost metagenome]
MLYKKINIRLPQKCQLSGMLIFSMDGGMQLMHKLSGDIFPHGRDQRIHILKVAIGRRMAHLAPGSHLPQGEAF